MVRLGLGGFHQLPFARASVHGVPAVVELIERLAADKGCTPAQLALAWVLAQGPDVVPIPGTRSRTRLDENAAAIAVELSTDELSAINELIPSDMAAGTRYPESGMALLNG